MNLPPPGYPDTAAEAYALLGTRQRLSVEDLKVLALIEAAGEAFYFALADATGKQEARTMLRRNGQEERGHAHRLLKAITLLGGEPFNLPGNDRNPYVTPINFHGVGEHLLKNIEDSEHDGDLRYQAWANAEPNAEVAKLYRQNGVEETRHAERVAQVKELLQSA